jgi:hypothetical protein
MFSHFSKYLSNKEQEILNDKFIIQINEYSYDIPTEIEYKDLQSKFITYVINNKLENKEPSYNKYDVKFNNNNKIEFIISVFKREYIIELLDNINKNSINLNLSSLKISS